MSDLKKTAMSMHKAASRLRTVGHHTAKPLQQFKTQSNDLGTLGLLLNNTDEIRDGMTTLAKLPKQLDEEWKAELGEVSEAFDLLDVLVASAAQEKKG